MTRYYKMDSRKIRWREYCRVAENPVVVLVLWFCKLFRIPFPLPKGIPVHESHLANRVTDEEVPGEVRRKWQPEFAQLAALGFHSAQYFGLRDNLSSNFNFVATFMFESGEVVARLLYLRQAGASDASVKVRTVFITTRADGRRLITSNAKQEFDATDMVDGEWRTHLTTAPLWKRHLERLARWPGAGDIQRVVTPDELAAHHDRVERLALDELVRRGVLVEMSEAEVEALRAPRRARQAFDADTPVLAELVTLQAAKRNWMNGLMLLVVTIILFTAAGSLRWDYKFALALVPILLFHEAGHFVAMRMFGYQNVRMFFIPFMGAAVSGLQLRAPAWKKALVSLAGPLPGIALGGLLGLVGAVVGHKWLIDGALLMLILNGFNLLPFLPLDGGWVLNAVVFARNRWAESIFRALAALALIGLGLSFGDFILPILGGLMLVGLPHTHRVGDIADRLRREGFPSDDTATQRITDDYAAHLLAEVRASLPPKPVHTPRQLAQTVMSVYERLHTRAPGFGASAALLLAYGAGLLGSIVIAVVVTLAQFRSDLGDLSSPMPTTPFPSGEPVSAGNTEVARADIQSRVIATPESPAAVAALFARARAELTADEAAHHYGQSVSVTVAGPVGERLRYWRTTFGAFTTNLVTVVSNDTPNLSLVCTVPDSLTGERLLDELQPCLVPVGLGPALTPPWLWPTGSDADERAGWIRARHTLRVARARLAEVGRSSEYRAASRAASQTIAKTKDKAAIAAAAAQLRENLRALRLVALDELVTNSALDPGVIQLLRDRPDGFSEAETRLKREIDQKLDTLLGVMPESNVAGMAHTFSFGGMLKLEDDRLRFTWVSFRQIEAGLPALVNYLRQQGCRDVLYRVEPVFNDDD